MKKQIFTLMIFLLFITAVHSQVAVNTDGSSADNSAMLDVKSTTKGMLIPRMTTARRNAITSPATGLMVFVTDDSTFYYYNGSGWGKTGKWILSNSRLYVDTTLSVGVGTTNPEAKFEVTTLFHSGTYGTNVCTGGIADASEYYGPGYEAGKAFDNSTTTYWSNNNTLPVWLQYDLGAGNKKRVAKYRLYFTNSSADYSHSPDSWTFEASNDGSSWTTLDTRTSEGWSANEWKEYTFSNTTQYRYYRINISDNKGASDNYVSIYEMEMMEENLNNHPTLFVNDNKVGIGTASPAKTLDVNGDFRLADGNQADGKILASDANGNASWVDGATVNGGGWTVNGNDVYNTDKKIGIGTSSPNAKLDIENSSNSYGVRITNNVNDGNFHYGLYNNFSGTGSGDHDGTYNVLSGSGAGTHYGSFNYLYGSGAGTHYGTQNELEGSGSGNQIACFQYIGNTGNGDHYGTENELVGSGTGIHFGTYNELYGSGTGFQYGSYQSISNLGNSTHYGTKNDLSGSGTGFQYGSYQTITNSGSGSHFGTENYLSGSGTGIQYGSYQTITNSGNATHYGLLNWLSGSGAGTHYGIYDTVSGSGTGTQYGSYQTISNSGNGIHYGTKNELSGTGSGNKYGTYDHISESAGGIHYGVYSSVTGSANYAGYFDGNVNITQKLKAPVSGDADLKAYIYGSLNASTGSAYTDESTTGFSSTKISTGVYKITFSNYNSDNNYLVIANALKNNAPIILTYEKSVGFFKIFAWDINGNPIDTFLNFVVYKK